MKQEINLTWAQKEKLRTIEQNRQQWPILSAFAKQKEWPINGVYQLIDEDSWKDVLTAAYKGEVPKVAAAFMLNVPNNINPYGTVMIGQRTSKFTDEKWRDWMAFLNAAAAECGIKIPMSKSQAAKYE